MDETVMFNVKSDEQVSVGEILRHVYQALAEKGYSPINQIVGYLLSGDPAYITSHQNARSLIRRMDRDELLEELVRYYLRGNAGV
ncbi:MAG: IreB family regulatory phosphoprotein [Peptococcaceae bacterium]|nr:IreB family regulatory phosphoprotein [Peptococcaceae bacterium]